MRRIRNLLLGFVVLVPPVSGCTSEGHAPTGIEEPPKTRFADTTASQHAIFFTALGHTGGPGAADVRLDPVSGRGVSVNGQMPLLTHNSLDMIINKLPHPRPTNAQYILVEAKVHVEQKSGRITSNPPSTRRYLGVVIDELIRVQWHTPPGV